MLRNSHQKCMCSAVRAREQRGIHFILDDELDFREIMNNARRKLEIGRASALSCKVTKPANPKGSSWGRPCASDWSNIETKR